MDFGACSSLESFRHQFSESECPRRQVQVCLNHCVYRTSDSTWQIKPTDYCDTDRVLQYWDDILRFIATIKLKETTASDLLRRLNSYSKHHGLYQALKAFGQILKSHFILRVIDEPALRMAIERVLNGIEHVHRFTRAVSVGNPREFLQAEKQEQKIAEACKRLIKNASGLYKVRCTLFLTQK
jgi:TnpA family transposase